MINKGDYYWQVFRDFIVRHYSLLHSCYVLITESGMFNLF